MAFLREADHLLDLLRLRFRLGRLSAGWRVRVRQLELWLFPGVHVVRGEAFKGTPKKRLSVRHEVDEIRVFIFFLVVFL